MEQEKTATKIKKNMWTTNPELAKLLANPDDGYKYTQSSREKVDWICPNCGNLVKNKTINGVKNDKLFCCYCSDGISYPEKFVIGVLNQLNINFIYQFNKADALWCSGINHRVSYDFYLVDYNCIIETHGLQHYERINRKTKRNLYQEQENDKFKEKLAKENNIDKYIIIDCRKSELEFIKNNILYSELSNILNLSIIDWNLVEQFTINNIIKYVCELWDIEKYSILEIIKDTHLSRNTITKYLKRGAKINWCTYNAKEEMRKNGRINGAKSISGLKPVRCITTKKEFVSIRSAARYYDINYKSICSYLKGIHKTGGKLKDGTFLKWEYII